MKRTTPLIAFALCWAFMSSHTAFGAQTTDILYEIERMASSNDGRSASGETVADGIEKSPATVSSALLIKLEDKNLTEKQLAVYVWALGLTKDETAVNAIKELHQQSESDLVRGNCLRALATIGGKQAGDFIVSALDATSDKEMRFSILNLLGQMRYEPALQRAEELLKQDPKDLFWQCILVFGKMGDKAVPFLLTRISDKDRNIRANTINVLGQWLISPEAAKPMQDQFWVEKDTELRGLILSSLERTISDAVQMQVVFALVVAKEKDSTLVQYARETLGYMKQMTADTTSFAQKKHPSAESFKLEYSNIFKSAGKRGDYAILGISSTAQDEPQLKVLRERILQRDSDEAFYDYQKVNEVIMRNRMIKAMIDQKTIQAKP